MLVYQIQSSFLIEQPLSADTVLAWERILASAFLHNGRSEATYSSISGHCGTHQVFENKLRKQTRLLAIMFLWRNILVSIKQSIRMQKLGNVDDKTSWGNKDVASEVDTNYNW